MYASARIDVLPAGRRRIFPVALFAALAPLAVIQAAEGWFTRYEDAMAVADRTGKPVLTVFTGSDWCPHCTTLEEKVLRSETFRAWAEGRVVLLSIDLPQAGISQAVRRERSLLCKRYGVNTFPSVVLLAPDGEKITSQVGYTGQPATDWVAHFAAHTDSGGVCKSLDEAVVRARGAKRPILLVVSRAGDSAARTSTASLINDPEFEALASNHFVVASVTSEAGGATEAAQSMENLLGGVELPPEAVEVIVTDDGQTPLFSQSGSQSPSRVVMGLRRFLAARQAARSDESSRR
ncbi:MAG: thioredoxin family protein [Planctomycetota bacterium]